MATQEPHESLGPEVGAGRSSRPGSGGEGTAHGSRGNAEQSRSGASGVRLACGLSTDSDPVRAAEEVCGQCAGVGGSADLAVVCYSTPHNPAAEEIANVVSHLLRPACLLGVSAEGVISGGQEIERFPGISLLVVSLPGATVTAFTHEDLPEDAQDPDGDDGELAKVMRFGPDHRGTILLADPASLALGTLLPRVSRARKSARGEGDTAGGSVIGGVASAGGVAGGNSLILNKRVLREGLVGVSLAGRVRMDTLVSQGCRGFGPTFVVTRSRGQMIHTLGGSPALEAAHEVITALGESDRKHLSRGLMLGRVVNEYKDKFSRGDFLIRNVVGADRDSGSIAVADIIPVGTTVRFFMRDQSTATEDLELLLDAQAVHGRPAGVLLCSCNGRGSRLFDEPSHDAAAFQRAFRDPESGESLSRGGTSIRRTDDAAPAVATSARGPAGIVPLAGFFCGGEIGPIGDQVFLHGHTAAAAIFRNP